MKAPLQQRLALYGFGWVQVDPRRPIEPWRWGIPGLQASLSQAGWPAILRNCEPVSLHSSYPLMSPSIALLSRIRAKQPERPLIYCQTAFEPPPKLALLKRLPFAKPLPFLVRGDPLTPLIWADSIRTGPVIRLDLYPTIHPIGKRLKLLRKQFPQHDFWCQEDGHLVVQLDLFSSRHPIVVGLAREQAQQLDAYLNRHTALLKGGWLVAASSRERLGWFQRDMVRLWGGRFQFWSDEVPSYRDVKGSILVPVTDEMIRWGEPQLEGWPILHLDGDERCHAYRQLRLAPAGMPTWCWHEPVLGQAKYQWRGRSFEFQYTASGWRSPIVAYSLPSLSDRFADTAACYEKMKA